MAVINNLNTDLVISNKINPTANITFTTNTVFVDGNLVVGGNSTTVNKTDLAVTDNVITLNKGETGADVTLGISGINIDRGSAANVSIVWNESIGAWLLTNDGITYNAIQATSATAVTSPQVYALVL